MTNPQQTHAQSGPKKKKKKERRSKKEKIETLFWLAHFLGMSLKRQQS